MSWSLTPRRSSMWTCLLLAGLAWSACSDDDGGNDITGPGDGGGAVDELLGADVFCGISDGVSQAAGLLFSGGGTVPGAGGGQIVVQATTVTFEDYSPDGLVAFNGTVTIGIDETAGVPTVTGTLVQSRDGRDTEILVAISIAGTLDDPQFGGTLTIGGEVVDLATVELPDCGS